MWRSPQCRPELAVRRLSDLDPRLVRNRSREGVEIHLAVVTGRGHDDLAVLELGLDQAVELAGIGLQPVGVRHGVDLDGAGLPLKQSIEAGLAQGPRLFVAGRALSQTGGHGDMNAQSDFTAGAQCGCCVRVGAIARVVDGVDALRKAVREEFQMGADQIKIMASGGVASPTDPVGAFGYSEDEIRAVVAEARGRGTYVMAHAYTPAAIERAVRCGVRTIEHGNLCDAATAAVMAEHEAFAIPTLVTYEALANEGAKYGLPPESVVRMTSAANHVPRMQSSLPVGTR